MSPPEHNLVTLLVGRWVEEGGGGREAVVDEHGRWTFDDLDAAARRAAGGLRAAGVAPGDRVMVALRDGRPWVQAFLGAAVLGAVAVPADPTEPERLALLAEDCEPAAVVSAEDEPPPGRVVRPEELDAGEPAEVADVAPDDLAYLIYSSGSTGRPKGVMHGHGDMRAGIATYAKEVLGLGPGDRCHSMARLFTSLGFGNGFFRVIGSGATAVLTAPRPSPRGVIETVARERVTVLSGVPTFWLQLARFLERHPDPDALATVRVAVSSGDSLPRAVAERLREVTGVELIEGLGCSECSNIVISTRPGEPFRPGVLGRPVDGVEVKLAGEDGAPVARGEPGRLWIRSDSNTSGYWRRAEETRELVRGDWIAMGDTLTEEEDGTMRHLGRSDDLFKVDARWVSPSQVEGALLGHPAVAEAAVIGVDDEEGLTRPAAHVVLAAGADPDDGLAEELRRHVAHELAPHMAPRTVTVRESLPRLPSGKLDRRRLREG